MQVFAQTPSPVLEDLILQQEHRALLTGNKELTSSIVPRFVKAKKQLSFAANTQPNFQIRYFDLTDISDPYIDGIIQENGKLEISKYTISATLYDNYKNRLSIVPQITLSPDGRIYIDVSNNSALTPGKYKIKATISEQEYATFNIEQDFTWGVIAFNTHNDVYQLGQKVDLYATVLDDNGATVCNAPVFITVTSPSGLITTYSTDQGTINISDECQPTNFTYKPDFYTTYPEASEVGEYLVTVSATIEGVSRQINDSFVVQTDPPMTITRIAATRIYPVENYQTTIVIKPEFDYQGQISESFPTGFNIIEGDYQYFDEQKIYWDVDWQAGGHYQLTYTYDAPDVSPQFYLFGKLEIGQYIEQRQWQVAADAIGQSYATRLWTSGFERNTTTTAQEYTANVGTTGSISTTTVRSGTYALRTNLGSSGTSGINWAFATSDQANRYTTRAYIRFATLPSTEIIVLGYEDASTYQASIRINGSGDVKLWDEEDNAQIGSTLSAAITTNTWYRLELQYDFGTTTVGDTLAAAMLDGNIFASTTTLNHVNGVRSVEAGILTSATADIYWDDLAMNQDGFNGQGNWVGDGKVVILLPDGDGTNTSWAAGTGLSNYAEVDDPPSTGFDDVTTYVACAAGTDTDDYTIQPASTVSITEDDRIRVVEAWSRARSSTSTSSAHTLTILQGSDTDAGASNAIASATWQTNDDTVPRNSGIVVYNDVGSTNHGVITAADIDAMQVRLTTADCSPAHQVSAIWLLIEYQPVEGGRLWSSGFELQPNPITEEWDTLAAGTLAIDTTTKRSGAASLRVNSLASGTEESVEEIFAAANNNGPFYFRTYIRVATAPASSNENRFFEFKNSANTVIAYMTLTDTLTLKLFDEDSQVGSASSAINLNQWYRVEVKVDATGAGSTDIVAARIDGSDFATSSTRNLSTGITKVLLGGNLNGEAQTTGDWYFDDIALNKGVGSTQNSYPGSGRIVHLRPNGNGDTVAWTNTYTNIDEIDPDDATTYISTTTANQIEEAALDDTSTAGIPSGSTINLTAVGVRMAQDVNTSTLSLSVRLKYASGSPAIENGQFVNASTTYYTNAATTPRPYHMTSYTRPFRSSVWTTTDLDSAQIGVRNSLDAAATMRVTTLWLLVDYTPPTINISGTCKKHDQTTDCDSNDGSDEIKVAYNADLQGEVDTTIDGSWQINSIEAPASGDIITVFINNDSDAQEANAVTKYDGSGDITGMQLVWESLTLGSADNQTITNANIAAYDNSVSGDEDIFYDVSAGNDLTVDSTSQSTQEELIILSGNTYAPEAGADLNTHDIEINGTYSPGSTTARISGSWDNNATLTAGTSTMILTATSGAETLDSTGASAAGFNALTMGETSGSATFSLSSALDVDGALTIEYGTLSPGSNNITLGGDLSITTSGVYTASSGNLTFDGTGTSTWSNSATIDDLGTVIIDGTTKTVNLASSVQATKVSVGSDDVFSLSSSAYILTISGSGTGSSRPFLINSGGTLDEGTDSTVKFTGTAATDLQNETYDNVLIEPSDEEAAVTYTLMAGTFTTDGLNVGGTLTSPTLNADTNDPVVDVNGNFTIGTNATYTASASAVFSVGGNWQNNGIFTDNSATVLFDATATGKTIVTGGTTSDKDFHNIEFNSGSGGWTIQTNNLLANNNFTITNTANSSFTVNSVNIEVRGTYSIADAETTNTTWTSSTLYLNSGTSYTIGSSAQNIETYDTLQIGANTDIKTWLSSATTITVDSSGSLYSQDHSNNNGRVYIWGDFHTSTNEYWSYATDFDGASLSGSERQADVRFDADATVTVDSGDTLNAIGVSATHSLVRRISTGGYQINVAGGTINFDYVDFDYLKGTTGLDIQTGSTVTSLDHTSFDNLVSSGTDAFITVASSVIGSATKTITGAAFNNTGSGAECNVNRTGTDDTGYWDFDTTTGTLDGETYDCKNGTNETDPGMLRWDDSGGGNTAPNNASSLSQKKTDDTVIVVADWTSETSVKFTATVSDPDATDTLQLCVEKDLLGVSFSNSEDSCGTGVSYTGTPLTATVTIGSLSQGNSYHWQARVKDAASAYSSWVSFSTNTETQRDFAIDNSAPSTATIYDGNVITTDADQNDGSLTTLYGNWGVFADAQSGIKKYEYSIGTSSGGTEVVNWKDKTEPGNIFSDGFESGDTSAWDSVTVPGGSWYNASWLYRKAITIDNTKVDGSTDLTNFVVLISITDSDLQNDAQVDGDDILFTSSNGTTKLDHEVERYISGSGTLYAWVEVPTLGATADTTIYMYYGNSGASNQQNITGTWDSTYAMVQHFVETSGTHLDSTSNNNDSTSITVSTQGNATAKIIGADDFNTTSDEVIIGDNNSLDLTTFTISGWFNADVWPTGANWDDLFNKGGSGGTAPNYYMELTDSDDINCGFWDGSSYREITTSSLGLSTGTYYYFACVMDNAGNSHKLYTSAGGSITQDAGGTENNTPATNSDQLTIGRLKDGGQDFNGKIDEIRFANSARSIDWIGTEYNNQNSPATFYAVGSEETNSGGVANINYNAGYIGLYGLSVDISNASEYSIQDNFTAAAEYYARFYINPNSIFMTSGDTFTIADIRSSTTIRASIEINYDGVDYRVRGILETGPQNTSWVVIDNDAWSAVELRWYANSSGKVSLWVNGTQYDTATGNTSSLTVDNIKLGMISDWDTGINGSIFIDNFTSSNTAYNGPFTYFNETIAASGQLHTGQSYYINVRATNNSEMLSSASSSDGLSVLPTLSFAIDSSSVTFLNLNQSNSWTDTKSTTTTVSTNAYNGYNITLWSTQNFTNTFNPSYTIGNFSGTNSTPITWTGNGFGYTTNDSNLAGGTSDRFTNGGPKYAGFSSSGPGDLVADHSTLITGTTGSLVSQQFTITYRVTTDASQAAGPYTTTLIYVATPNF